MPILLTDSPCISQCKLDEHDLCVGCGRSRQEIKSWKALPDEQRHDINMRLLARGRKKVRKLLIRRLRQLTRKKKAARAA